MIDTYKYKRTCSFCGKERMITETRDDGMDYYGHKRGSVEVHEVDNGCDCELGRLAHKKIQIKEMCLNCASYINGYCTNKKELEEVNEMFNFGKQLEVKTPTRKCKHYSLNTDVFKKLLK